MPCKALNYRLCRRVFIHLLVIVFDVDIVPNTKEFLVVLVRTSKKHCSYSDNIVDWEMSGVWSLSFEHKLHLTGLQTVHFYIFKNLIVLGV